MTKPRHEKNDKSGKSKDKDPVREANLESFPASDPPAHWASAPVDTKAKSAKDKDESRTDD